MDPPYYLRIAEDSPFPDASQLAPFRAVVVLGASYSDDWQKAASEWLVESGCLYMMAWGPNCSSWDDSVDWANIEKFEGRDIPDEALVMTSWHENEPLEDVFWFVAHAARAYSDVEIPNTMIVDVSTTNREKHMLDRFLAAQARNQLSGS